MQCQDKIWLEEQYITKKRSMKDIAEECNVCSSTILKWLRKLNIPTRTKKESILIYHSKKERGKETYKNRKWLYNQYINLKKSSLQIAKECECSKPVILYYLKKFNIDRRQGSEALKGKTGRDKGFNQKEETKKKISEKAIERYKDPNNHPMIGKHQTEESKEKSRKRLKGKKYEEIYGEEKAIKIKKKMSISQQGRIQSEETRKKISEAQKGRTYEDIYGEEKAQEIKGKISKALKGRTYEDIYGEERAIEIKEKISEKAKGDKNPNWKGGIDKRESLYNTKEWRNIRKIIYLLLIIINAENVEKENVRLCSYKQDQQMNL